MKAALLLLILAAPHAGGDELSIRVDGRFEMSTLLPRVPSAGSYGSLLENVAHPVVYSLEESAGFSDVDPDKLSIHGDSWLWNRWYVDGFDITDPLFDGAPALDVPFALLSSFSVGYAHALSNDGLGGPQMTTLGASGRARQLAKHRFSFSGHAPNAGGLWPLAVPIMNAISGKHPRDRMPPPPDERRHQRDALRLNMSGPGASFDGHWALEVKHGTRRFSDFNPLGDFVSTFDEGYAIVSTGANVGQTLLLAEYRERDNLFAELGHASHETAHQRRVTGFVGHRAGPIAAGLTIALDSIAHDNLEFEREILDADGESLSPFAPDGRYVGLHASLLYRARHGGFDVFGEIDERALIIAPAQNTWSNPLVADGRPYGRIDWRSANTAEFVGHQRLGVGDHHDFGAVDVGYELSLYSGHAINSSGDNTIVSFDIGAKAELHWDIGAGWDAFAQFAKVPVPLTSQLARTLDPDYLEGRTFVGDTPRLIDTTGGAHIDVDGGLIGTSVYSVALGLSHHFSPAWAFHAQGLAKVDTGTHRLEFEQASGYFRDDVFFLSEGEKRYRLRNVDDDVPAFWGGQFQLIGIGEDYVVSAAFSAFNAVGVSPFGNGPTANDVGIIDHSTANPNSANQGLANLDGDRAFMIRTVFGYRMIDTLWGFITFSHRDGQPFAFFEQDEHNGQIAMTYRSPRGSPLKYTRPLLGPREDFRVNVDAQLEYSFSLGGIDVVSTLLVNNLLDFGNEISERSSVIGKGERAALESEIGRSLWLGVELRQ